MEREILFRGKRVDNGIWIYGDLIQFNTKTVISGIGVPDETGAVIPETVGQFTGLEKDGIKYFSGKYNLEIIGVGKNIVEIVMKDGQWQVYEKTSGYCQLFILLNRDDIIISEL